MTLEAATTGPTSQPASRPASRPSTQPTTKPPWPLLDVGVIPTKPGDHKLKFRTTLPNGHQISMAFLLHLPADYDQTTDREPLLMFLHGAGECGTDCAGLYVHGPMMRIKPEGGIKKLAATFPFIVLAPQCPPRGQRWDQEDMYKSAVILLREIIKKTRTDPDRVYATGLSMGGKGTWLVAEEAPDLFAAIAPVDARAENPRRATDRLKYVSIWSIIGKDDWPEFTKATREMTESMAAVTRVDVRETSLVGFGHGVWWKVYESPQFYEWLLAQRRPDVNERRVLDAQVPPRRATTLPTRPSTTAPAEPLVRGTPINPAMPIKPGHYRLSFDIKVGKQPMRMDYILYLPKGYQRSAEPHPLFLFLHEQETIGVDVDGLALHGPNVELERHGNERLREDFPFIVVSPRCAPAVDWKFAGMNQALLALLDDVCGKLNVDRQRVYVSGINAGAVAAGRLAVEAPGRFAAIAPVMTEWGAGLFDGVPQVGRSLPSWTVVPKDDSGAVDRMKAIVGDSKVEWRVTPMDAPELVSSPLYGDPKFYEWLLKQQMTGAAQ